MDSKGQGSIMSGKVYLLIEEGQVRDQLTEHLTGWGFRVTAGAETETAVNTIQQDVPTWYAVIGNNKTMAHPAVLGDTIRDHPAAPRIIMITQDGSPSNISRLQSAHAVLILPFTKEELKAALT